MNRNNQVANDADENPFKDMGFIKFLGCLYCLLVFFPTLVSPLLYRTRFS